MGKRHKQNMTQGNTVRTLQNDYVRSSDSQAKKLQRKKVFFRRRMLVFTILASVIVAVLVSTILNQNERLAEKHKEKEEILAKLQEAKDNQEKLKLQITKLEDDEYIAKLARKEFFLSEDGEIIFTIPNEAESKQGNEE